MTSRTFVWRSLRSPIRQMLSPSPMMSSTLRRGLSDEMGSWKIICSLRRWARSSEPDDAR